MTKEEIIELIDMFVNQNGLWYKFKDFLESNGYTPADLGLQDED